MKVKELIDSLQNAPQNIEVFLQVNGEVHDLKKIRAKFWAIDPSPITIILSDGK